jgi:hypothetical protein
VDLGWKNSDPGWKKVWSRINIPDPQHWWWWIQGWIQTVGLRRKSKEDTWMKKLPERLQRGY